MNHMLLLRGFSNGDPDKDLQKQRVIVQRRDGTYYHRYFETEVEAREFMKHIEGAVKNYWWYHAEWIINKI